MIDSVVQLLVRGDYLDQFDKALYELTSACHDQSWSKADLAVKPKRPGFCAESSEFNDRRVNQAISMMHDRIHECTTNDFVLTDIAREAGLSRPHFFKLFRSNTGVTPKVYMNTLLVEHALEKLMKSDYPVTSIALDLGFASQPSFSRFFRDNVGISPSEYRKAACLVG